MPNGLKLKAIVKVEDVKKPVATFPARNAPMGVTFVTKQLPDPRIQSDALGALRGSWWTKTSGSFGSRSSRQQKVDLVRFDYDIAKRIDDLILGPGQKVLPAINPHGTLFITRDSGVSALYRLKKVKM